MSASDSDHNYYTLDDRRQVSQSSGHNASTHSINRTNDRLCNATIPTDGDDLPTLPALSYSQATHAASKRPSTSTSFEQYASNASLNGFTSGPPKDADCPDPHEFYRQYRDKYRRGSIEGSGHPDIVVVAREDGMTTSRHQRKPSPVSTRTNISKLPPLTSQINTRPTIQTSSFPSADRSPLSPAKSNPALSSTARNRQTSLKDLVNRFNQTPDEAPPLPNKAGSRSTSATSSPIAYHPANIRSHIPLQSKPSGARLAVVESSSGQEQPRKASRPPQRRKRSNEAIVRRPPPASSPRSPRAKPAISSNAHASQSMTDLNPTKPDFVRKPLFGEVLALTTSVPDPGYGIPAYRRRRGSEGSMHSPNPMFPNDSLPVASKVSPSSPTAWYLGVTPSLDGINIDKPMAVQPP
ncbi:T-lymphoma invasion and metastasis-inducing protein 1, partial [Hypocenomyce scalaris]|nr:T-lymphoma invasion and metastasis-inducing protein 1 [Hypocenomyce scalaris]